MERMAEARELELAEFGDIVQDLLDTDVVQSMAQWLHHGKVSCLDHSVAVAFVSFHWAKKLGLDAVAVARGGLLHDLYLYHKRDKSKHPGLQSVDHPKIALVNGRKITHLSEKEENIILAHMWPFAGFAGAMPQSPEAHLVNLVDTMLAAGEFCGISKGRLWRMELYGKEEENSHD